MWINIVSLNFEDSWNLLNLDPPLLQTFPPWIAKVLSWDGFSDFSLQKAVG